MAARRRNLPERVTRRWAAAAALEALGKTQLAMALWSTNIATLDPGELKMLHAVLLSTPEWGSPGIHFEAPFVMQGSLPRWRPPGIAVHDDVTDTVRVARPADQAGAVCGTDGLPVERPRGAIRYSLGTVKALALREQLGGWRLPTRRPGTRGGRASSPDVSAALRHLLGLIERCEPEVIAVAPATCAALLLWLDDTCRPENPGDNVGYGLEMEPDDRGRRVILPTVDEVEPWVALGESMRRLATAISRRARARPGEYRRRPAAAAE